uniref:FBA_2 domain-containing protein n=2 Tax=Caenorhabditis tropicalis TaxID=1561998 RepID=A0A1I7UTA0_9PELO
MYSYEMNSNVTTERNCCIGGELIELSFLSDRVVFQDKSVQKQLLLANHAFDVFPKSTISVEFSPTAEPATALNVMKIINQRRMCIKELKYSNERSELASEILDESTEVTDTIKMFTIFPDDFIYMPPRPFKAIKFSGNRIDHWFNIVFDFRRVSFKFNKNVDRTAQFWNTFFNSWRNRRLQCFSVHNIGYSEYELMVERLSDGFVQNILFLIVTYTFRGAKKRITGAWFEVKTGDGAEFMFCYSILHFSHIMTKQAYLEYLKKGEFYNSLHFPPYY